MKSNLFKYACSALISTAASLASAESSFDVSRAQKRLDEMKFVAISISPRPDQNQVPESLNWHINRIVRKSIEVQDLYPQEMQKAAPQLVMAFGSSLVAGTPVRALGASERMARYSAGEGQMVLCEFGGDACWNLSEFDRFNLRFPNMHLLTSENAYLGAHRIDKYDTTFFELIREIENSADVILPILLRNSFVCNNITSIGSVSLRRNRPGYAQGEEGTDWSLFVHLECEMKKGLSRSQMPQYVPEWKKQQLRDAFPEESLLEVTDLEGRAGKAFGAVSVNLAEIVKQSRRVKASQK